MVSVVQRMVSAAISHRVVTLGLFGLLWAVSLLSLSGIEADNSTERLVPETEPRLVAYREYLGHFGSDEFSLVSVERPQGVFDRDFIIAFDRLAADMSKIPHTVAVTTLMSKYRTAGKLGPLEMVDMQWLKTQWMNDGLNIKTGLLNKDATVMSMVVPVLQDVKNARRTVVPAMQAVIDAHRSNPGFAGCSFHLVGQPAVNYTIDKSASEVGFRFFPIFFILTIVTLIILYRSPLATLAALLSCATASLSTVAAMVVTGTPLSLITQLTPVALFIILMAGVMHLLNGFFDPHAEVTEGVHDRLVRVLGMKWMATLMSVVTTMVGFGSLAFSTVPSVREFGLFTAFGMFVGMMSHYLLFPTLMSVFFHTSPRVHGQAQEATPRSEKLIHGLFNLTERFRWPVFLLSTLLGIVAAATLALQKYETNPMKNLDPSEPARADIEWFEKHMTGAATIEVVFTSETEGAFFDPAQIGWLTTFHQGLESIEGVRAAIDLPELLKESKGLAWGFFESPTSPEEITFYLNTIRKNFPDMLKGFVTADGRRTHLTLIVDSLDYVGFRAIEQRVAAHIDTTRRTNPPPHAFTHVFTGQTEMLTSITEFLSSTLFYSFGSTLLGVFLLVFVTFMSLRLTLVAMLQNLFGIALMFGLMYVAGISFSVPTILIASILLGIEVDNTIHLLHHANKHRREGRSYLESMHLSLRLNGRAIFATNATISCGFMVFVLSSFPPIRHFGSLIAAGMFFAIFGVLVYLPSATGILVRHLGVKTAKGVR